MPNVRSGILLCVVTLTACGAASNVESTSVLAELEPIEISEGLDALAGEELNAFRGIVDSARIVSLGQSRHDTHEQLEIQAMLSRNLIADLGFRIVILEESFSHCRPLDAFVMTGDGDLRAILNGLAGWYLWDTEEMVAFFEWVRHFNAALPMAERVHVYGMDITAPAPGIRRAAAEADALDSESHSDSSGDRARRHARNTTCGD